MTAVDAVGRVQLDASIDLFNLPPGPVNTAPRCLTAGPDGNLWMTFATEQPGGTDSIYRVNTTGQLTGQFSLPTLNSFPYAMTAGPDGALWFTEFNTNRIGRITT